MLIHYKDFSIVFEKSMNGSPICTIYSGHRCHGNPGILQVSNFLTTVFGAMDYIDERWYKTENRQSVLEEFVSS